MEDFSALPGLAGLLTAGLCCNGVAIGLWPNGTTRGFCLRGPLGAPGPRCPCCLGVGGFVLGRPGPRLIGGGIGRLDVWDVIGAFGSEREMKSWLMKAVIEYNFSGILIYHSWLHVLTSSIC